MLEKDFWGDITSFYFFTDIIDNSAKKPFLLTFTDIN